MCKTEGVNSITVHIYISCKIIGIYADVVPIYNLTNNLLQVCLSEYPAVLPGILNTFSMNIY